MNKDDFDYVSVHDLRMGLFVDLDLGWVGHPFATGRFKISSERQLHTLRSLQLERYRYVPSKSDGVGIAAERSAQPTENLAAPVPSAPVPPPQAQPPQTQATTRAEAQRQSLIACERRFNACGQQYSQALDLLHRQPTEAAALSQHLVQGLVDDMQTGDIAIRLLTDGAGDKATMHPINVTVVSLLLGRSLGLQGAQLQELGLAALLHDIGKSELPERVRRYDEAFSAAERHAYQSHVDASVRLARTMGLGSTAIEAIAQHHEHADGTGFPQHCKQVDMGPAARILAVVNRYDGLCNPAKPRIAMTPHEALASMFSQQKAQFDAAVLSAFIRMIGVYPPGSVVQLNDERLAMVVSVNAARPLKPCVVVHEPATPRQDAPLLDLEQVAHASIRRSLKPASLSAAVQDYLQPRQRLSYFFEVAASAEALEASA